MVLREEESIFFETMASGVLNTQHRMAVRPIAFQHKLDSMSYWKKEERKEVELGRRGVKERLEGEYAQNTWN